MIDFKLGMNYKEFKETAIDEHRDMILMLEKQGQLSENGMDAIEKIEKQKNIVVFTETRCEDSATTIPFLMKLADLNKNIKVTFFKREGNEEILEKLTGAKRVPSILALDEDGEVSNSYIEFPSVVNKMIIGLDVEERKKVALRVRSGEFNSEIESEMIKILK